MNKDRRKRIDAVVETLSGVQIELEELAQEENEAFDNLPEGFQQSEKGEQIQINADALEEASNGIDTINTELQEIVQS